MPGWLKHTTVYLPMASPWILKYAGHPLDPNTTGINLDWTWDLNMECTHNNSHLNVHTRSSWCPVAYFTKEGNPSLSKQSFKFNGGLPKQLWLRIWYGMAIDGKIWAFIALHSWSYLATGSHANLLPVRGMGPATDITPIGPVEMGATHSGLRLYTIILGKNCLY